MAGQLHSPMRENVMRAIDNELDGQSRKVNCHHPCHHMAAGDLQNAHDSLGLEHGRQDNGQGRQQHGDNDRPLSHSPADLPIRRITEVMAPGPAISGKARGKTVMSSWGDASVS